jgi:hypothetical protein
MQPCKTFVTKGLRDRSIVARDGSQIALCSVCDGQSGKGVGFPQVLRFSLPILIPPTTPYL